jgi:hypothetical protein
MKQKVLILDIETNGLLSDMLDYSSFPYKLKDNARLWCVVFRDFKTNTVFSATNAEITLDWVKEVTKDCTHIVAHNGLEFDFIALKLFGILDYKIGYLDESDKLFGRDVTFIDTLLLSRLFNPDRFGGHSLEAWGERLGHKKTDFRQVCIDKGYIDVSSKKGEEFKQYNQEILEYCIQDTLVGKEVFSFLAKEKSNYDGWNMAIKQETKLADLAVRREHFGFAFDKDAALNCLEDLTKKMQELSDKVNPILPPKKMNKGELADYTPPKKVYLKDGSMTNFMKNFLQRTGATIDGDYITLGDVTEQLPCEKPLKEYITASIDDLDHVKSYLIELGWNPTEFRERDLTKDSKKQDLPYEKRLKALERWAKETWDGKYKKHRLELLNIKNMREWYDNTKEKLRNDKPVRVPTSPSVRVGVEKELCPNLIKLGDKVSFAKDFALYLTYRHRKSSIAGGDIEDMDFDSEIPNTGFLSMYREVDKRIPTPAITIGAVSNRYRHIGVCNISRVGSLYGYQMRSLFGAGEGFVQLNFDFSSLEARIMGHYAYPYKNGKEMAEMLLAEKPNDWHSITAVKLGKSRTDCKSINYACLPMHTKVLTKEGWKFYDEISIGEAVLSFNENTGMIEDDTVLEKHFFYDKELFIFSNNFDSFKCTEEHRWYGWKNSKPKTGKRIKKFGYFEAKDFNQETNILLSAPYIGGDSDITPDESELIGWILSEGSITWSKKSENTSASKGLKKEVRVLITQSINYYTEHIENLLNKLNISFYKYPRPTPDNGNTVVIYVISNECARKFIDRVVGIRKDKYDINWVKWVISLKRESLERFMYGFFLGDGNVKSFQKNKEYLISQNKGNIFDGVATAMQLLGTGRLSFTNKSDKCISIRKKKKSHLTCQEIKKDTLGIQDTFCLTTKNSSFIIWQDNFIGITGNCIYGAQPKKIAKMTGESLEEGKRIYEEAWEAMPALKALKEEVLETWENNNREFIIGIDGRKIIARSPHSLLNSLFQSAGAICAKYTTVLLLNEIEKAGFTIDPFIAKPDACEMISMHDEVALAVKNTIVKYKVFDNEEEGKEFIKNYSGAQLTPLSHVKKWYVALPNPVSESINKAIAKTCELMKLNIPLGFEWQVGANWAQTH